MYIYIYIVRERERARERFVGRREEGRLEYLCMCRSSRGEGVGFRCLARLWGVWGEAVTFGRLTAVRLPQAHALPGSRHPRAASRHPRAASRHAETEARKRERLARLRIWGC